MESEKRLYSQMLKTRGEAILNGLYPKEFEYYLIALELLSSQGITEEYFVFPVMPQSIKHLKTHLNSVKLTAGGTVTISNPSFIPTQTTIQGNFGRRLKFFVGQENIDMRALSYSTKSGNIEVDYTGGLGVKITIKSLLFSPEVKSGFGALKILEAICNKSDTLDSDGKPYTLYMYNPAIGHNYICKIDNFTQDQSLASNRIWGYTLSLKNIARVDEDKATKERARSLTIDIISKDINFFARTLKDFLF